MSLPPRLEKFLIEACDLVFAVTPQKLPQRKLLEECRIVSHRGIHDNLQSKENTLEAFDLAEQKGIWGIELDFRWTRDLVPVVVHDPDLDRVFGINKKIAELDFEALTNLCPQVPSLEQVVGKYGKKMHLMIEVKQEPYPNRRQQDLILEQIFSGISPCQDYHLISLDPEMLERIECVPNWAKMPVAELNVSRLSQIALERNYAGILGHYFLIGGKVVKKHLNAGQKIGTGYPNSRNGLSREINRGVNWLFSNDAEELDRIIRDLLQEFI